MAKKVTIRQVAEAAGVSITTVSQILNGKGDRFSKKTRDKVLEVRNDLHYVPDFSARNLILHSSKLIGVLIPDLTNPFFSTFVQGIQSVSREAGYLTMVFSSSQDPELENYYLTQLLERSVDGLIIASSKITGEAIDSLLKPTGIPYLLFDQNQVHDNEDRIEVDDYHGGQLAAQHLLGLGHHKLAMMVPDRKLINVQKRWQGFYDTLAAARITPVRISAELTLAGGYEASEKLIASGVTGVFCANDEMALGLYRGLYERGLKIPDDISVIGFDNIAMDQYVVPKLTTISQPIDKLGEESAHLLLNRLSQPQIVRQLREFPVELKLRESTAAPKKGDHND